jgi:hypothetical protein
VVPASVARRVASQPGSTWYRLLTDPAGNILDQSSTGYRPGAALTRAVQAWHQTCVAPGCTRPADAAQADHEVPWPHGPTSAGNLSPKCPRHHIGKTAGRFASTKAADGTITWTYPTGHTYTTNPPRHPVDAWPTDWTEPDSLTHIQHGLAALCRETDRATRARVDDLRRRLIERRLTTWYAQAPPDPEPSTDDYAALRDLRQHQSA